MLPEYREVMTSAIGILLIYQVSARAGIVDVPRIFEKSGLYSRRVK
jgi:hypothetical protein